MNVLDLTPNTKFYTINNGKIVAAKFNKAELGVDDQIDCKENTPLHCTLKGELQLANGTKLLTKYACQYCDDVLRSSDRLYLSPEDARNQTNVVRFTISNAEFVALLNKFGYKPTIDNRIYKLWFFNRHVTVYNSFGPTLTSVVSVDLFNGTLTTQRFGSSNKEKGIELYNTREECDKANHVEVVDFDDEPTKEVPTNTDLNIRIVYFEITR